MIAPRFSAKNRNCSCQPGLDGSNSRPRPITANITSAIEIRMKTSTDITTLRPKPWFPKPSC
ncbi:Hypothetical protein CINCED_3A022787 [Cinara cedri]|uniref:Uncharacterized protein n=1 Tax=Cinara cedri TaxID=506608 RepID=A0A5E4MIL0_9HEMI|nr:Hypothetical protein CINCED_3A022787 [Cinara cedri]